MSKRENGDGKKFKLRELIPIFDVQNSNFDNSVDFERCPLSPISSFDKKGTDTYEREDCSQSTGLHKTQMKESGIDFNDEFKKFASQYEERVGTDILSNIPGSDILGTTMKSLRRLYIKRKEEMKERESDETQVFKFFNTYDETHNQMDWTILHNKEVTDCLFTKGELPVLEESPKFYPSLNPLSSDIKLLENGHLQNNEFCSPTPFLHLFENGTISGPTLDPTLESNLLPKEYNIPKRELNFVSPPIRFFPRNMF